MKYMAIFGQYKNITAKYTVKHCTYTNFIVRHYDITFENRKSCITEYLHIDYPDKKR